MVRYTKIVAAFMLVTTLGVATLARSAAPDRDAPKDDPDWGTVKGRIVWPGNALPVVKAANVDRDKAHCLSKGNIDSEEWVVNKTNKGIRWVTVWLAPEPGGKALPIHPDLKEIKDKEVVMDQPCCRFEPHVLGMRQGQVLVARNSSPIGHSFHYLGYPTRNPGGNVAIPSKEELKIEKLKADERVPVVVSCDIHPWMKSYVRVFDHPYFAVTDADGNFEIRKAPAGTWRLKVWHETGWRGGAKGKDGEPVTIKGAAVTDLKAMEFKSE